MVWWKNKSELDVCPSWGSDLLFLKALCVGAQRGVCVALEYSVLLHLIHRGSWRVICVARNQTSRSTFPSPHTHPASLDHCVQCKSTWKNPSKSALIG